MSVVEWFSALERILTSFPTGRRLLLQVPVYLALEEAKSLILHQRTLCSWGCSSVAEPYVIAFSESLTVTQLGESKGMCLLSPEEHNNQLSFQHNNFIGYLEISHNTPITPTFQSSQTHPHPCDLPQKKNKKKEKRGKGRREGVHVVHILTGAWSNSQWSGP